MVTAATSRLLRPVGIELFTAASAAEALAVLQTHASVIGLVISDYSMPGMNGADLLRLVRLRWPEIPRILLTGVADISAAASAVNEGQVSRLFVKPWPAEELRGAIVQLLDEGHLRRENRRLQMLLEPASGQPPRRPAAAKARLAEPLTQRELEVLGLLAQGLTNRRIGERLYLSPATIKVHVAHLVAKLGVADRTQAAARAMALGLLEPDAA